jgi:hypothetical protein
MYFAVQRCAKVPQVTRPGPPGAGLPTPLAFPPRWPSHPTGPRHLQAAPPGPRRAPARHLARRQDGDPGAHNDRMAG